MLSTIQTLGLVARKKASGGAGDTISGTFGSNLVGHWTLDSDGTDSTGNANFTFSGAVNTTALRNNGYYFDGVNDIGQASGVFSGLSSSDLTYSTWVNFVTKHSDRRVVFGHNLGEYGGGAIQVDSSGNLGFRLRDSGNNYRGPTTSSWTTGVWYHIVAVIDGTTHDIEVFINGSSIGTDTSWDGSYQVTGWQDNASMGARRTGTGGFFVKATIDECTVWSRKLSSSEVTTLYNGGVPLAYS